MGVEDSGLHTALALRAFLEGKTPPNLVPEQRK
jgi:hypothetical protein